MVKLYGPANGFGWKENEIIAAQIISVPVSLPVQMADRSFRQVLVSLVVVGIVTLLVLDLLLYFTVVRPSAASQSGPMRSARATWTYRSCRSRDTTRSPSSLRRSTGCTAASPPP